MVMKYCVTIEVVGLMDDNTLMALVSSMVDGATVYFYRERKIVQVWGQWREMLRATALAGKIARATSTPAIVSIAQKGFSPIPNTVSDGSGALYDVPPQNIISVSEVRRDVHTAVGAPVNTDVIRLYTEAKPNLEYIAAQSPRLYGDAHVLFGIRDEKNKAFGVWQGSVERTAVIDIYGLSRIHLRMARNLARRIITENNQSAVLMAVIRKDGRAYARLIERKEGGAP